MGILHYGAGILVGLFVIRGILDELNNHVVPGVRKLLGR